MGKLPNTDFFSLGRVVPTPSPRRRAYPPPPPEEIPWEILGVRGRDNLRVQDGWQ